MIGQANVLPLIAAAVLSGCAANGVKAPAKAPAIASVDVRRTPASSRALDDIAAHYVTLTLEIGTQEDGFIDAYYGPPELRTAAEARARDKPALLAATRDLTAKLDGEVRRIGDPLQRRRAAFLRAQLRAAEMRLLMMQGTRFAFADEAERLFGVRPQLQPLANYDAALAKIAALVPGEGPIADRVEAYLDRFTIPKDRLQKTFDAAIARCRGRSAAYIPMPTGESFRLEFVTGKSWSGYNYYQGGYHSLIQINTDLPIRLSRALDLGCHEGYPGHHLLNVKLEQTLVNDRSWAEFGVYLLYSPQSLIAEGTANYGIDLALPDQSKAETERDVLMPIAEISVPMDDRYWQLLKEIKRASGARLTIAQQYLDGMIDRPVAVALTQKYLLVSPQRAEQSIRFAEQYRSYVINYGIGEAMVRAYVERGKPSREQMWQRLAKLISEPTLPSDLIAP